MHSREKYLLLKTVQDDGILPITSVCNLQCQFCSHYNNPPGLEVYAFGHLQLNLITELIEYLPAEGPIIIGESATRIIEGEPLAHPDFPTILKMIRAKFPDKLIKLTSNGSFFNRDILEFIARIQPLELNISLNCSSPEERVFLMADHYPDRVFQGLEYLANKQIPFHGSVVAVPHLLSEGSLVRTIELLAAYNPRTVRIYLPGFTRYTSKEKRFKPWEMYDHLCRQITGLTTQYIFPILLEPPSLSDFKCTVKGVMLGSPAIRAGVHKGDIIIAVNQQRVISRADGFQRILNAKDPLVSLKREQPKPGIQELDSSQELASPEETKIKIQKKAGESSGIVLDFDLDPQTIELLVNTLEANQGRKALVSSVLGSSLIKSLVDIFLDKKTAEGVDVLTVKNGFFGGSIFSAGLLVNADIIQSVAAQGKKYDLIVLPGIIYDIFGNDLTGKNYEMIEKQLGTPVKII